MKTENVRYEIPFNKPFIVGKELYYIADAVISNRHLSGDGPFSRRCEKWLQNTLNCPKALLTHSCTAALEMAALLIEIKEGDEVIVPSFTFVSTANAFVLRGAKPVFVDVRPDTFNIDEKKVLQAIGERTKAIVPVHYGGTPADMDSLMEMAEDHDLWVIEDAAQALLSKSGQNYLGCIGHLGCLSFHETKNIISGEGGALLINSEDLIEKAEILREKGTDRSKYFRGEVDKYTWQDLGSSFLPGDLIAAFLYAQLEFSEKIVQNRRAIVNRYDELLRPMEQQGFVKLPTFCASAEGCGHIYYLVAKNLDERNSIINFLKKRGIAAVFHYIPLHSSPAGLKFGRVVGSMENTNNASDRIVRLPLYYGMSDNEIKTVTGAIYEFFGV